MRDPVTSPVGGAKPIRPESPLAISTLLAKPGKPDLGHEISREILSADRTDALVSFVTWSDFRRLEEALRKSCADGKQLRLLTTSYIGATEADAILAIAKPTIAARGRPVRYESHKILCQKARN